MNDDVLHPANVLFKPMGMRGESTGRRGLQKWFEGGKFRLETADQAKDARTRISRPMVAEVCERKSAELVGIESDIK